MKVCFCVQCLTVFQCLLITSAAHAQDQRFTLSDTSFTIGQVYQADIRFGYASDSILVSSYPLLDSLVTFLQSQPDLTVEVGVHMDQRGSDHYSIRLDQKRAEKIVSHLVAAGISPLRLVGRGYGEKSPLIPEETILQMPNPSDREAAYAKNRRVEVRIIRLDQ